jgi:hypothetical protein
MKDLVAIAEKIAVKLIERRQTIAVAESSTGGLISASLLAVPGASAYFLGGGVIYTREARRHVRSEYCRNRPAAGISLTVVKPDAKAGFIYRTLRSGGPRPFLI